MRDDHFKQRVGMAARRGVEALVGTQACDGSFGVTADARKRPVLALDPIFTTASVLIAVGNLLPNAVLAAALNYIQSRRRDDGLWAWTACSADADDTALCLAALIQYGRAGLSENKLLRTFWRSPAGPFDTWISGVGVVGIPADPVVNCNVAYCLGYGAGEMSVIEREAVQLCLIKAITDATAYSQYYSSLSTLIYSAGRAGIDIAERDWVGAVIRRSDLRAQEIAEIIAAKVPYPPELIEKLLGMQQDDGRWIGSPWFFDFAGEFCSDAYATAVAVEGLVRSFAMGSGR